MTRRQTTDQRASIALLEAKNAGTAARAAQTSADAADTHATAQPYMRAHHSADQTLTTATWTALALNTMEDDTVGGWSSSSAAPYTCQSGYDGVYDMDGGCAWASNATGIRGLRLLVNGTVIKTDIRNAAPAGVSGRNNVHEKYPLVAGDVVTLEADQTSGGNLACSAVGIEAPVLSIQKVRNSP